ncbi:beta-glucosidase [Alkalihalophilus pseudofirmus OF4]|jgi:beta-glucosidase|uniref:Beta-glucosidase n=2 Tax=Alkalihalophilus pseudofirmus TaxID=79885 RepID=D3FS09_ALKPO|nr:MULTISPECIES: GH1 family beta-glucosidase [Alkalihalophilus]ADC51644.1 beta-glucosidase [Alkalihalophilus pseudofirmus OF4]MCM3490192.1 GH1 family beta-glucosidase [Alkalihalophilus marmarensis]MDV2884879.1 GH1 family beta-glucosidase [Alkalihalophilus pseudofirmus]MED1600442.1 GH1 family beta-glucosidase [Alkalihalophilus marmarensis]
MTIIQFPKDMKWGVATASYQIEGAANEGGRGTSIWDTFSKTPGKVVNGDNGDVACGSYHKYEEDIEIMDDLGVDFYRFSVAWPRIFPEGTGEVNQEGLDYYHNLVDRLLEKGIEPMCTLYHWDLPQALQDKGGWDNRETIEAFLQYAELMFKEFEGKIKHWITFNEPWCVSFLSNYVGAHAPGNNDLQLAMNVAHHLLVAHGKTVIRFRELGIKGQIGYAPNVEWNEPYSNKEEDIDACKRVNGYFMDWFFDPVFKGTYPDFMVKWFEEKGAVLQIEEGDMEIISQPIDFLGINYYSGGVGRYKENEGLFDHEKVDAGYLKTDIGWNIYPEGFYKVLTHINENYGNVPIYITENGACINDGVENGEVKDDRRTDYLKQHLVALQRSIESGVNIKGYLTWSLLDNFEWAEGYTMRFGIVHVNYRTLERTKKDSFYWYKQTVANNFFEV